MIIVTEQCNGFFLQHTREVHDTWDLRHFAIIFLQTIRSALLMMFQKGYLISDGSAEDYVVVECCGNDQTDVIHVLYPRAPWALPVVKQFGGIFGWWGTNVQFCQREGSYIARHT